MMITHKFLMAALALSTSFALLHASASAKEYRSDESLRAEESAGTLEHYHHEYYSHSYAVTDASDQDSAARSNNVSQKGRHGGKANTGKTSASIAFGGHRHHVK